MTLSILRLRPVTGCFQTVGNGLFTTTVCDYHVYKDPQYKTIPSTHNFKQKHYDPKFKRDRGLKVFKVDLPDFNEEKKNKNMTPDEARAKMKEKGIQPVRPWTERPIFISSTAGTFEPYVPPEGDGKVSFASKEGAKQRFQFLEKKGKSMLAVRKIREFDEDFETREFTEEALQIYINAHKALADHDEDKLHQLVTERAYPIVTNESKNKTIRWQFIKSVEPASVVHARTTEVITKENIFAQITVRLHTQQTLAVYDRFGRLIHGSEVVARDVLEYVVFEKHVANTYGMWRIHDKIIPDWMPPRQPIRKTYRVEKEVEVEEESPKGEAAKEGVIATSG
ncbi:39S ribosomal protein L45, mitochondrial [Halocaridina rubra]|uniref:Large ribosomal subunit protein mL45 n=1 Tax=Halocaridina rubra TaxID=373956 RepID=A0AAN8XMY1_HALRR